MAIELIACGLLHAFWLVVPALALGGFGNGLALVHDRLLLASSTPETLHGRLFALQKTCTSFAFALSFLLSGALIAGAGVETAFLACGRRARPRPALRAPAPARRLAHSALRPPAHARRRASLGAHGEIAQLVEHTTENRGVPGSSPGLATPKGPASRAFLLLGEAPRVSSDGGIGPPPSTPNGPDSNLRRRRKGGFAPPDERVEGASVLAVDALL